MARFIRSACIGLLITVCVWSQDETVGESTPTVLYVKNSVQNHFLDIGAGLGLDYGGLAGAKVTYLPTPHLGVFGSAGWYITGLGWQLGLQGIFPAATTKNLFRAHGKIMYGSNGGIVISNGYSTIYSEIFYGFTLGVGVELRFGSKKSNGFDVDLSLPIHDRNWDSAMLLLSSSERPWPVTVGFGYHHSF